MIPRDPRHSRESLGSRGFRNAPGRGIRPLDRHTALYLMNWISLLLPIWVCVCLPIRLRLRSLPPPRACGLELGLTLRRSRVDLVSISGRSRVDLGSISGPSGVDLGSSGSISGRSGLVSPSLFFCCHYKVEYLLINERHASFIRLNTQRDCSLLVRYLDRAKHTLSGLEQGAAASSVSKRYHASYTGCGAPAAYVRT